MAGHRPEKGQVQADKEKGMPWEPLTGILKKKEKENKKMENKVFYADGIYILQEDDETEKFMTIDQLVNAAYKIVGMDFNPSRDYQVWKEIATYINSATDEAVTLYEVMRLSETWKEDQKHE